MRSMTAYARVHTQRVGEQWAIEIHSVNRKMLDLNLNLPRDCLCFDIEIRKWIAEKILRGQISVRIIRELSEGGALLSKRYLEQLKELKRSWQNAARDLGFDEKEAVDLRFLAEQMQLIPLSSGREEEADRKFLKEAVDCCLAELLEMKEREGKALAEDVLKRLKLIEEQLLLVSNQAPNAAARFKLRLQEKLAELAQVTPDVEERIQREVVILIEKGDITEELTRLSSHLEQFRLLLRGDEKSVGRTLDFLTQEMHREINTIGSKCADKEISQSVVLMKGEVEKIREQIQNLE